MLSVFLFVLLVSYQTALDSSLFVDINGKRTNLVVNIKSTQRSKAVTFIAMPYHFIGVLPVLGISTTSIRFSESESQWWRCRPDFWSEFTLTDTFHFLVLLS